MKAIGFIIILILTSAITTYAQIGDTVRIKLSNNNSIYKAVNERADAEADFIDQHIGLDSILRARTRDNLYSLNQRFFEAMRTTNYKIEKLTLKQNVIIKQEKERFLKLFLPEKKYKKYEKLVAKVAKADKKKFAKIPAYTDEVKKLRAESLGWDLLQQVIIFSD